jgi:LPXTG-motif cell wall-anchored protein
MVAMAASLVGGVSTAHAAPYNPRGDVDCTISVAAHTAGHHVVFRVGAVANSNPQPRGTLTITLTGGTSWSRTVHYPGHAITVVGPVVSAGSYRVTTHFTPANTSAFRGCRGALPFQVGVGPIHNHHGPGDNNGPLGVLPDTGGPDVMWLLVGTALLGAGATSVVASRRRRAVAVG